MVPFRLEDFFDEFEHQSGTINLASSDALPWAAADLWPGGDVPPAFMPTTLSYPDVMRCLVPGLEKLCKPTADSAVLPTSGAAEAIALVLHDYRNSTNGPDRDFIAVPSPGYGAFAGLASLLGIRTQAYVYRPHREWTPDFEEILSLSKTCRALIVNNPHNPTGHVIPSAVLNTISGELAKRDAMLIVDEVFRVPGETSSAIELGPNVVVLSSLSKTYGLPGLRLGWIVADKKRVARLRTVQQYLTLTLNGFTVAAAAKILEDSERFSRRGLIQKNRSALVEWAKTVQGGLTVSAPLGGTTVCLTINSNLSEETLFTSLKSAGVLLVPGNRCFELRLRGRVWFRLGYGTNTADLMRGLDIVKNVIGAGGRN